MKKATYKRLGECLVIEQPVQHGKTIFFISNEERERNILGWKKNRFY